MRRDPGELPAEVAGFVGRQRELAIFDGLLGTARLVTVTGPGGVGKTRVAVGPRLPADHHGHGAVLPEQVHRERCRGVRFAGAQARARRQRGHGLLPRGARHAGGAAAAVRADGLAHGGRGRPVGPGRPAARRHRHHGGTPPAGGQGGAGRAGEDRYAALFRDGADRPLDLVVKLAVTDADVLPGTPGRARPAGLLTGRERQIATLVGEGMSNRDIAQHLGISKRTVDAHLEHIFGKLGITSRVQLATIQLSPTATSPERPPPRPGPPGP